MDLPILVVDDKITVVSGGFLYHVLVRTPSDRSGQFSWNRSDDRSSFSGVNALDEEGIRWCRGWHERQSDEGAALLVAWSLKESEDAAGFFGFGANFEP